MKIIQILFFLIIASLSSCDCGCDSSGDSSMTYNNLYAIITSKETVPDKYFIVRGVADTTLIGEIHSKNIHSFTDSIFYNKKVGDTVFFAYIRKDRFWHTSQKNTNIVAHDNDSIQIVIVGDAPFYKHTVIKVKGANSIKEFSKVKNITKDASGFFVFGETDYNEWKTNDSIK